MSNIWSKIFLIFVLSITTIVATAQRDNPDTPKDNSPYSRLGLGDLVNQNFAGASGYGGLSATFYNPYRLNIINPAANAFLKATAFEVGVFGEYSNLQSDTEKLNGWNGNLGYLSLGFPLRNVLNEVLDRKNPDWGFAMNFSLVPYSTVGYNIEATSITESQDTTLNLFQGRGGNYRIVWGNSIRYKDFSFGLNLGYLFGKTTNDRIIAIVDDNGVDKLDAYRSQLIDETSLGGLTASVGLMYRHRFMKVEDGESKPSGKNIIVGFYGNTSNEIGTNTSQKYFRYRNAAVFSSIPVDTIRNVSGVEGKVTLPAEFGFGVMYEQENKFRFGFDFNSARWSQYTNDAKPENLMDSWRISLGTEYIPDYLSYNNAWKRMRYRAGFFFQKDPRAVNEQLSSLGLTLGLGIPVVLERGQVSFVDLAIELGRFGSESSIQDTYARIIAGFTLNDNTWFFKRKFD